MSHPFGHSGERVTLALLTEVDAAEVQAPDGGWLFLAL